jgi:4'-phosphopantetheinyl transferase
MPNDVLVAVFNAEDGGLDANVWTQLRNWLQPDERERADHYKDMEARASFLIGRGMARAMLSEVTGVPPADWRFADGAHGRPEIAAPSTPYHFNLAHSHGAVACIVGRDREIGVDIEYLKRPAATHDVAARICAPEELEDVEAAAETERQERFLVYWTLKEAYLKARGLGISVHLADVAFSLASGQPRFVPRGSLADADTRWTFRLAQPNDQHLVAVAVDTRDGTEPNVRFQRFANNRFPIV